MNKSCALAALPVHGVVFASAANAGGFGTAPVPWIDNTLVSTDLSMNTNQGRDFGRAMPSVLLGKQALKVMQHTETEIIAELPPATHATKNASYRLTVTTNMKPARSSTPFFAHIVTAND